MYAEDNELAGAFDQGADSDEIYEKKGGKGKKGGKKGKGKKNQDDDEEVPHEEEKEGHDAAEPDHEHIEGPHGIIYCSK